MRYITVILYHDASRQDTYLFLDYGALACVHFFLNRQRNVILTVKLFKRQVELQWHAFTVPLILFHVDMHFSRI